ncbi:MAG: DPP IV N-terminal domain-containing protein [Chloroflexi bacterium]|nr:DPP IV N-terminal domain-containing protein [Chloroflexota bacterium]
MAEGLQNLLLGTKMVWWKANVGLVAATLLASVLLGGRAMDWPDPLPLTSAQTSPAPAPASTASRSSGRLAYIGGDGNVYVTTPDRNATIAVTSDATAAPEYPGYSYHRLSWSPDGRLAFAGVTRTNDDATSVLYVVNSPEASPQVIGRSNEHFVIYIYWSPLPCPNRPTCRRLAYLIEEEESISLRLVEIDGETVENQRLGRGRPFYFSWAPDSQRIIWHTGGARRHNPAAQLALYDVDRDELQLLPHEPGLFLAPAWSPQGDRWLGVSAEGQVDSLQSFGAEQPVTLIRVPDGQVVFAWSPQGDQVAYATREKPNDPFYSAVHIFDLRTGQAQRITAVGFRILAFFWSPDGQRLAYLTRQPLFDSTWMQWRVYNLTENRDRGYKMFHPSFQMNFVISSFNQYAQSDRFWSPDSRYLVYADRDQALIERVWLIDTWAEDGNQAILVDEGAIGLWSWH